jgi:hypothetical protein
MQGDYLVCFCLTDTKVPGRYKRPKIVIRFIILLPLLALKVKVYVFQLAVCYYLEAISRTKLTRLISFWSLL